MSVAEARTCHLIEIRNQDSINLLDLNNYRRLASMIKA